MRRQLLLSTAALLATVALASAQNMPGGQSQGSQGGAASQHSQSQSSQGRGGEAQRGAAQEHRGAQEQGRQGQAHLLADPLHLFAHSRWSRLPHFLQ